MGDYSMIASLNLYFRDGHDLQGGGKPELGERDHRIYEGEPPLDCPLVHHPLRQDSQGSPMG